MYSVVIEETGETEQGDAHREGVVREGSSEVLPELGRGQQGIVRAAHSCIAHRDGAQVLGQMLDTYLLNKYTS